MSSDDAEPDVTIRSDDKVPRQPQDQVPEGSFAEQRVLRTPST